MIRILFLISLFICLSGCATVLNNGNQVLQVSGSEGRIAKVKISTPNGHSNEAQLPVKLYAKPSSFGNYKISVIDPCYETTDFKIKKRISPFYWLNALNLHGFYVDYFSGYIWQYERKPIVPLTEKTQADIDCVKETDKNIVAHAKVMPVSNLVNVLSLGIAMPLNINSSEKFNDYDMESGGFISYSMFLSHQLMLNLRLQGYDDNDYDLGVCVYSSQNCFNAQTDHASVDLSIRGYISPRSNIYFGLGAAKIRVDQHVELYENSVDKSFSYRAKTYGGFVEVGWLKRVGHFRLHANTMIDFVDFRLATTNFTKGDGNLNKIKNQMQRNIAKSQLHSAAKLTNFSIGVSFAF